MRVTNKMECTVYWKLYISYNPKIVRTAKKEIQVSS